MPRATRRTVNAEFLIPAGAAILLALAAGPLSTAIIAPAYADQLQLAAAGTCPESAEAVGSTARRGMPIGASVQRAARLDSRGELLGRRLTIAASDGRQVDVELPVESFVGPARGQLLVYTLVDADGSQVHAVDLANGCDTLLARPQPIVRSAVIDPSGSALYVHGVTAQGRRDNGVLRFDLDGSPPTRVVAPLPDDDRFGVTFGTQLEWSSDGATLAVQSCGAEACRSRLLDLDSGAVALYDAPGQGALIGVTADHLVTYAACPGLPCPVLSTARSGGGVEVLVDEASSAELRTGEGGATSVVIAGADGILEVAQ